MKLLKRERYYDGYGNEFHIDQINDEMVKVSVNDSEIELPLIKLQNMVINITSITPVSGKHAKVLEVR